MSSEYKFRQSKPARTCTKTYANYSSYRQYLESDFNFRCGYCNSHSEWHKRSFHIDHFAPKSEFSHLEKIYSNLVYSCSYCNLSKSDKWISKDETINIIGDKGFVDPCNPDYDKLFKRNSKGVILPQSKLAKYIHTELKLGLKIHSIFWMIERIDKMIISLKSKKTKNKKEEQILGYLYGIYHDLSTDLRHQ